MQFFDFSKFNIIFKTFTVSDNTGWGHDSMGVSDKLLRMGISRTVRDPRSVK